MNSIKENKNTRIIKKKEGIEVSNINPTKTKASYVEEFENRAEIKRSTKIKSWYIFVLSFLDNARNECDFLIECKRLDSNNKYLIIGIIYNFKHGLEIFLKAFSRSINEKIDKGDQIHDTKRLLDDFKKQLKFNKLKKDKIQVLNKGINELEKIIEKYNEIDFFKKLFKEFFFSS